MDPPKQPVIFPILDESIFQGAQCSSAVAENFWPNVPGSEFQASGTQGGAQYGAWPQYGKAGGKKHTAGRSKNRGLREVRDQFLCKFQDFSSVS
jgi:hypothetical protein